ncbi:MAG: hypothetical protein ACO3SP_08155 [Ilumatobacteraceae bacterium]
MNTPHSRILMALASGSLLLVSCGGDDPVASGDQSNMSEVSVALENLDETAALAGVPEECLSISMAMMTAMGAAGATATDAEALAGVPAAFEAIRGKAPEELRGDIDTVKAGFVEYLAILERYGYDYTAMIADAGAVEEMSGVMSSEEFMAANERVSTWLDELCNGQ